MRGLVDLVATVAVAVGAALLIQVLLVKPYRIPTGSMIPTLEKGQRILVDRLATHPGVGDVVVFHPPAGADDELGTQCGDPREGPGRARPCDRPTRRASSETYVKRVVGLPGDTLRISRGDVYRNGIRELGAYIQACTDPPACTFPQTITVPKGSYYMMGDNRGHSDDSRFWGPVPQAWIIGTAFLTYWPPSRIGTL
ncbi:MAG: signal peptidase I [Solirubrobacteraceae bacterium]